GGSVGEVQFGPVQRPISLNPEPEPRCGLAKVPNPEPVFGFGSGSVRGSNLLNLEKLPKMAKKSPGSGLWGAPNLRFGSAQDPVRFGVRLVRRTGLPQHYLGDSCAWCWQAWCTQLVGNGTGGAYPSDFTMQLLGSGSLSNSRELHNKPTVDFDPYFHIWCLSRASSASSDPSADPGDDAGLHTNAIECAAGACKTKWFHRICVEQRGTIAFFCDPYATCLMAISFLG
ncbi:hypothetical protein GGX14DRAFT_619272, partial [Mycena pura]